MIQSFEFVTLADTKILRLLSPYVYAYNVFHAIIIYFFHI